MPDDRSRTAGGSAGSPGGLPGGAVVAPGPPSAAVVDAATPRRPSAPMVFGVLSIVFGSLATCASAWGTCAGAVASDPSAGRMDPPRGTSADRQRPDPMAPVREAGTRLAPWSIVSGIVQLAASIALIVLGVGQVGYRRWARKSTVVWGIVALVLLLFETVKTAVVVGPEMDGAFRQMQTLQAENAACGDDPAPAIPDTGMPFGRSSGFSLMLALGIALFMAPYPILLIVFFTRRTTIAAMRE